MTRHPVVRTGAWRAAALAALGLVCGAPVRSQDAAEPPGAAELAPVMAAVQDPDHRNSWRSIIIHHSASAAGNAAVFDRFHRRKGWDCVAYHFVIDNGDGGPDGRLEVGPRWSQQKHGAHAGRLRGAVAADEHNVFNEFGIGICLVGDLDRRAPTPGQLRTLERLTAWLRSEFDIAPENILGHGQVTGTDCPGRHFPWPQLFAAFHEQPPAPRHYTPTPTAEKCLWCREGAGGGALSGER